MKWKRPCCPHRCFLVVGFLLGLCILSYYFLQLQHWSGNSLGVEVVHVLNLTKEYADGVWTVNANNRLGNQMGEYATLYALAKLHGKRAWVVPGMVRMLGPIFKITLPHLSEAHEKKIPWQDIWVRDWMSERYEHIEGKYVRFTGCPNSWTFYHHIRDEIRREFTFHDSIKKEVNEYLAKLRGSQKNVTYVGVHIRRGDYVVVMPRERKGVVADKGYMDKAMAYFRSKYQTPVFVVASNDMKWCKKNIDASKGDVYFAGDGIESSPKRDFAILAHCNHTIMTIGTFGYWAAYLAGGETVYLANFTLPDSPYLELFRYEASFLPEWTGIPADLSPLLSLNK
ncbi:galactoside alpha-(1,2)-fucosyltransferase 2-like [Lissotriton helveticus]